MGEAVHVVVITRGLFDIPAVPLSRVFEKDQVVALSHAEIGVGVVSVGAVTMRYSTTRVEYPRKAYLGSAPVFRSYRRAWFPARWESAALRGARNYRLVEPLFASYTDEHGVPDVIHAHNLLDAGLLAHRLSQRFGIPYVVTEHTSSFIDYRCVEQSAHAIASAATSASRILAVGHQLKVGLERGLAAYPIADVDVVPNVLPSALVTQPLARRRAEPFTVLGIGGLIPRKDYALLIRAFAAAGLPPDARLVLGGSGPEVHRLRRLGGELGLDGRLSLLGSLTRDQVLDTMKSADVFAHPSRAESFGVVVIEALAMGLPVVATASGGPEEIVGATDGLIVKAGDERSFARALEDIYSRRLEFDSYDLRRRCLERYGPIRFARTMETIYSEVAGKP